MVSGAYTVGWQKIHATNDESWWRDQLGEGICLTAAHLKDAGQRYHGCSYAAVPGLSSVLLCSGVTLTTVGVAATLRGIPGSGGSNRILQVRVLPCR